MRRASSWVHTAALAAGFGLTAIAGSLQANAQGTPPADFGSPPSGQYPILFNDHHVYAKPDVDKQNRVLAALVRGNTILVPLRSMFEQMGATVSYDPASKTVDVSKPGSDVKVTVGKPEVVINGESRPLDVPPEIYQGVILVPVRVISEGMGAYVQWVPQKKTVVVRYVPAPPPTPPPTPAPTRPPTARPATPPPTPVPTPTPAPAKTYYYEKFIVGDYIFNPTIYNEFNPGNTGTGSYTARGAIEFPLLGLSWMLEGDWRHWSYPHVGNQPPVAGTTSTFICPNPPGTVGCVTVLGGVGQAYVPSFTPREDDLDGRFAIKVADPRLFLGIGYFGRTNNYGYPTLRGWGFGAEKLPDLDQPISLYGSLWYYPTAQGSYGTFNFGRGTVPAGTLGYRVLKYQIGGTWNFGEHGFPLFLDVGFLGEQLPNKINAPVNAQYQGLYAGLGIHF